MYVKLTFSRTTMRHCLSPVSVSVIKNTSKKANVGEDLEKREAWPIVDGSINNVAVTEKKVDANVNTAKWIPSDPAAPPLSISPKQ